MIAVDTNILARFYCDDPQDPESQRQRPRARRVLLESPSVFVPLTVMLEFEWVMRGFYGLAPKDVGRVLHALAGIEHSALEDRPAIVSALASLDKGLDFADALHVARSSRASEFLTFDQRLAKRAKALGLQPAVVLLS